MEKRREKALNLANALTAARLVSAPFMVYLILESENGRSIPALLLFVAAAVTDSLDGYAARKRKEESRLGALFDPVADKVFGLGVLWALVARGLLPAWMIWSLALKEGLLLLGGALLLGRGAPVSRARTPGKVATVVLFFSFALLLAGLGEIGAIGAAAGVGLSLLAGVDYALVTARQWRRSGA